MRSTVFALVLLSLSGCAEISQALNPGYTGVQIERVVLFGVPETKPATGERWDAFGPADPLVVVTNADGGVIAQTEAVDDPVQGQYPLEFSLDVVLDRLDLPISVVVYDEDVAADDVITRWELRPSDLGLQLYPSTVDLSGPNGQPMARLHLKWTGGTAR